MASASDAEAKRPPWGDGPIPRRARNGARRKPRTPAPAERQPWYTASTLSMYVDDVDNFETKSSSMKRKAYVDTPLWSLTVMGRALLLEKLARQVWEERKGARSSEAHIGTRENGSKRSRNQSSCDFEMKGRRVEVKSALLTYLADHKSWVARWAHVKRAE
eukprot:CAMPEP_0198709116 /NCGR_PEP_ID=MMETSP1471-20131121/1542_1 /TAXON_ID=41880 /ORGANISM="Pycnococcus provasolii, Strain RCC733" /LENGTH=160 /DNA_ID=CAMNT_0044468441 /DNA_START=35 /DNA_END=514 /DNA_ORIENTATION=+